MTAQVPNKNEPIRALETRKGTRYRVVLDIAPDGARRRQITRTFEVLGRKSKPEKGTARAFVAEVREGLTSGSYTPPSILTVGDLLDQWLTAQEAKVRSGDIRQVTLDGYRTGTATVRHHLGSRRVTDLRHSDIEAFKAWALREGNRKTKEPSPLGNDAVSGALGVLTRALDLAVLDSIRTTNPAARVERPSRKKRARKGYWSPAQMDAFRLVADREPLVLAVALRLVLSGLRRSEACGLSWDAVDLAAGLVEVRQGRVALRDGSTALGDPKSEASARIVPVDLMQPGTVALLRELKAKQGERRLASGGASANADELVLVDDTGRPVRPELVSDTFQRVAAAAGLPKIPMHATRHSIASELAADPETPDIDAAALLGHTVAVFHGTYAQRSQEATKRAAARWAERRAAGSS